VSATPPSKRSRPPRAAETPAAAELEQEGEPPQAPPFWTACPSCCHLHQFDRSYEGQTLLCPSCSRPFAGTAMSTPPPIVPGTDMYFCSWGFFPMGFPGGPAFAGAVSSPGQQPPSALGFYPMGPYLPVPGQSGIVEGNTSAGSGIPITPTVTGPVPVTPTATAPVPVTPTVTSPAPAAAMPVNSSHQKVEPRKRGRPKGSKNKKVVIEIN
jgi:hypothetical protein